MKRILFLLTFLMLLFIITRPALIIENREGEVLLILPLFREDGFSTYYIHSVEKTPVIEFFQVEGRSLLLTKTIFSSYGAGLPLDHNGFSQGNDFFLIQDIHKTFSIIYFRVSTTADQYLLIGDKKIYFQEIISPRDRFSIRGAPLYSFFWDYLQWLFSIR